MLFFIPKTNLSTFNYPTKYTEISSEYGYRDIFNGTYFHNGIDFLAVQGSTVYSCSSGVVVEKGFSTSYGNHIVIEHSNGYKSLYGHLSEEYLVELGDYVYENQSIGTVGPKYLSNGTLNGITTGPHLHFTVFNEKNETINPKEVLNNL